MGLPPLPQEEHPVPFWRQDETEDFEAWPEYDFPALAVGSQGSVTVWNWPDFWSIWQNGAQLWNWNSVVTVVDESRDLVPDIDTQLAQDYDDLCTVCDPGGPGVQQAMARLDERDYTENEIQVFCITVEDCGDPKSDADKADDVRNSTNAGQGALVKQAANSLKRAIVHWWMQNGPPAWQQFWQGN